MATLTAHLRRSEDHGRLTFHPDCPICCDERLTGTLPAHALVGSRAQALIVAGVLAASTATPTVAVAQEADQITEGAFDPGQSGDDSASTDFDPGGDADDLPFEGAEVPDAEPAPGAADPDVLETEPVTDIDAPVADAGGEPAPAPSPTPTVVPPPTAAPAPAAPPKVTELSGPGATVSEPELELEATVNPERAPRVRPTAPTAPAAPTPVPTAPAPATSGSSVVHVVNTAAPKATAHHEVAKGERFHVVVAGESLWSIARDELGGDASPARIAREVNRLWALNSDRIATGDPDLLRVGTKLSLR
jgi:hypothetical protein